MAIRSGVGRPEAHGALGELLLGRQLKYALLELKVAAFLDPRNLLARRDLTAGLERVRLDQAARRELESLVRFYPAWADDSTLSAVRRALDRRSGARAAVMEF